MIAQNELNCGRLDFFPLGILMVRVFSKQVGMGLVCVIKTVKTFVNSWAFFQMSQNKALKNTLKPPTWVAGTPPRVYISRKLGQELEAGCWMQAHQGGVPEAKPLPQGKGL